MKTPLFLSVLVLGALLPHGYAQAPTQAPAQTPPQVVMKPIKASLFKNGAGYLSFEGKMPKSERVELTNLPIPSFGTFWMNASAPTQILKLTSMPVKTKIKVDSGDFYEIAKANIGKSVSIYRNGNESGCWGGIIVSVSSAPKPANLNLIGSIEGGGGENGRILVLAQRSDEDESNQGSYAYIPVPDIKTMLFENGAQPNKAEREVEKTVLYVDTKNPAVGTLSASCLVKGISWVPEYRMDLRDEGKANFSAQALVINDLMDFDHVELSLVSGYPALKFSNVESPLAGRYKTLEEFLTCLDSGGASQARERMRPVFQMTNNSMFAQSSYVGMGLRYGGTPVSVDDIGSAFRNKPQAVEQSEDLFFYPIKDFSSSYGSTTLAPLFGGEVSYEHLYIWNVAEQKQLLEWDRRVEQGSPAPEDTSRDIWHCIKFKNPFSLPLTKGALQFTSKGNIVGQGVVEFTSSGQDATVRVNKTMQVATSRKEKTISSESVVIQGQGTFQKMIVEGTLTMKNYSGKPMKMEVFKQVVGTPISASDDGKFSFVPSWNWTNPNGRFTWAIDLPVGESKTLTYQYSVLDR